MFRYEWSWLISLPFFTYRAYKLSLVQNHLLLYLILYQRSKVGQSKDYRIVASNNWICTPRNSNWWQRFRNHWSIGQKIRLSAKHVPIRIESFNYFELFDSSTPQAMSSPQSPVITLVITTEEYRTGKKRSKISDSQKTRGVVDPR